MHTSKILLAGAIGGLGLLGFGSFEPSSAQVNALSISGFNESTRELTLTSNRGVVTLPIDFNSGGASVTSHSFDFTGEADPLNLDASGISNYPGT